MGSVQEPRDFGSVKERLEEIARAVDDESLSLDDALDLYEEAVALGLKASDLLEEGIRVDEAALEDEGAGEGEANVSAGEEGAAAAPASAPAAPASGPAAPAAANVAGIAAAGTADASASAR